VTAAPLKLVRSPPQSTERVAVATGGGEGFRRVRQTADQIGFATLLDRLRTDHRLV